MVQNLPNVQSLNCANVDTRCRTEQLNSGGFEVFLALSSFARDVFVTYQTLSEDTTYVLTFILITTNPK